MEGVEQSLSNRNQDLEMPTDPQFKDDDVESTDQHEAKAKKCCNFLRFEGVDMAQGYVLNNTARGAIVMSNIFLTNSLVFLASREAGCVNDEDEIIEGCDGRVYGQDPAALIANISVISGLLSAFLMPLCGAVMDYTHHRWNVGVLMAILMSLIQGAQVYTVQSSWFIMAILQSITGFFYQVQVLAVYAYLPEIARVVGEATMIHFQSYFTMIQFFCQALFLIIVIACGYVLSLNSVVLAQVSQGINVVWITIAFVLSWTKFPHVPASRKLPEDGRLWLAGFTQVGRTTVKLYREHRRSLFTFLCGVVFAESAVNAFTLVSVIYLGDNIGMTGDEIGIFFLITLVMTLPGSRFSGFVCSKTNPNVSMRLAMFSLGVTTIIGALILERGTIVPAYIWGVFVGFMLGWFYPSEGTFFSVCLPKGQDAELTGFYVYSTIVLGWLPPLVFSALVDAGVSQRYGVIAVSGFLFVSIVILSTQPSWEAILEDVHKNDNETLAEEVEGGRVGNKKHGGDYLVEPTEELSAL